jgi:hypothetical protein
MAKDGEPRKELKFLLALTYLQVLDLLMLHLDVARAYWAAVF